MQLAVTTRGFLNLQLLKTGVLAAFLSFFLSKNDLKTPFFRPEKRLFYPKNHIYNLYFL